MLWYYADEGKRAGPIDDAEFQALVETGVITPDTLVWNETLSDWTRYAKISQEAMQSSPSPEVAQETPQSSPSPEVARQETPQSAQTKISFRETGNLRSATCCECGKIYNQDDMIRFRDVWVCANCKPIFVQKLKEGARLPGELVYAGFWIRFLAKFIDAIIQWVIGALFSFVMGILLSVIDPGSELGIIFSLFMNLMGIGIAAAYTTFFIGKYGATPGKMALGLKVITSDGGKVSYARALGRHFAEWLSSLILLIGYIMAAFDEEKRSLHDRICNTRVIKTR